MIRSRLPRPALSLLAFLPLIVSAQKPRDNAIPLRNWTTPLYWQPNQTERPAGGATAQLVFSANAVSTNALTFVAITPCRLVDTRGVAGGFNGMVPFAGPAISSGGTLTIPVQSSAEATADTTPAPCGVIPAIAAAYSFNLTVVPHGAVDYISLWPNGGAQPFVATLDDPQAAIVSNAAIVPAGTPMGGINVYNAGPATADVIIDMNGYFTAPTDLNNNTAVGAGTLAGITTGNFNTAIGGSALITDTSGSQNTASGAGALYSNTTGNNNMADGFGAMSHNTTGGANTASGSGALALNTTGANNTATGSGALFNNTTASGNTADGENALYSNTTGINNTATGLNALQNNTTGNGNTATGEGALSANTTGLSNTATGAGALNANTTGINNTATGENALQVNTTGISNTANGGSALELNTTGGSNTAAGTSALQANTTGSLNTASGASAMQDNTTGAANTATGFAALGNNTTGNNNIAIGANALQFSSTGFNNVASGYQALAGITSGSNNIAIGFIAGSSVTGGNSNNIHIGNAGAAGDNAVIKIGTSGTHNSFFVAGVGGVTTGAANAVPVVIDSNGQLGTVSSSQRFKEDIQDMGDASSGLLRLRPVTFRYKQPYEDGSKPIDYGLIAEEVAQVYPDLAVKGADGQIQTVQYQKLTPMLLNELQKQDAEIRLLKERLAALEAMLSNAPPR